MSLSNIALFLITVVLSSCPVLAMAQNEAKPTAVFSFNSGTGYDEVSGTPAKLVGVNFTRDRFGNRNSAVYCHGSANSYINLGNYPALKPRQGSISLWVKIDSEVWSGEGRKMNSMILTKHAQGDDFYEAYNITYFPEIKKITAICTQDSLDQICISGSDDFELFAWHHLAISYDNRYFSFYIDGVPEKKLPKNFETTFLSSDSVIVGVTGNKKNNRFFNGSVDDIVFYDRVLSDAEINNLYLAPNPNRSRIILNRVLLGILILAVQDPVQN